MFELTPHPDGSWTEKVLHNFDGTDDGASPVASLVFDAAGNLYGTTSESGPSGAGTVFELTPHADGGWTETVLHSFSPQRGPDGAYPHAGLIIDAAGHLYGTTSGGGAYKAGTVFEVTP